MCGAPLPPARAFQDKHKVMIEEAQLPILLNLAQASLKLAALRAPDVGTPA